MIPFERLIRLLDHLTGDWLRNADGMKDRNERIYFLEREHALDAEDVATLWRIAAGENYPRTPNPSDEPHSYDTPIIDSPSGVTVTDSVAATANRGYTWRPGLAHSGEDRRQKVAGGGENNDGQVLLCALTGPHKAHPWNGDDAVFSCPGRVAR